MAEGSKDEDNPYSFYKYSKKKSRNREQHDDEETNENEANVLRPDLGIGSCPPSKKASESSRREENPFSFKHFLKNDSSNSYVGTGARPKVYTSSSQEKSPEPAGSTYRSSSARMVGTPEITAVLPDFVQDHLVIEQCYMNNSDEHSPQLPVDLDNLPDFALDGVNGAGNGIGNISDGRKVHRRNKHEQNAQEQVLSDLHLDLSLNRDQGSRGENRPNNSVPLDLPNFENSAIDSRNCGLPFDLPLVAEPKDISGVTSGGSRNSQQNSDVNVSKSLPDFLSDGALHSSHISAGDTTQDTNTSEIACSGPSNPQSPDKDHQRLREENGRLQRELEIVRRQLAEETRRRMSLEQRLSSMHEKDTEETETLEKAIENVEDNLKRTTKRAVAAEGQVAKFKAEMKILMNEVVDLRKENRHLRSLQPGVRDNDPRTHSIAQQLHGAANTAEHSLRQLLSGVENLHVIAATLENMYKIQERTDDILGDVDDYDRAGPAL